MGVGFNLCDCRSKSAPLKVLELYSGIGGVHCAFHVAGIPHKVVGAVDINTSVNEVYHSNFEDSPLWQRNIQSFTVKEMEKLQPDIITMSPPCQPFTRVGLKQDSEDPRSESFFHVLDVISKLEKKPSYIFLENVKGFECSKVRDALVGVLQATGYTYQEFLLTPSQLGIPNSRLRYYILAKSRPMKFSFTITDKVQTEWPCVDVNLTVYTHLGIQKDFDSKLQCKELLPLHHFLEEQSPAFFEKFMLPDKILLRYAKVLDIVDRNQYNSCCFTKAYGHYVQGTGSVLHTNQEKKLADVFGTLSEVPDKTQQLDLLRTLGLRYFTPKEVANLMCFPDAFRKLTHIERIDQKKLSNHLVH